MLLFQGKHTGDPTLKEILSNSDHTFDLAVSTTQCKHSHIKKAVRVENHCVWETSSTSRLGKKRGGSKPSIRLSHPAY